MKFKRRKNIKGQIKVDTIKQKSILMRHVFSQFNIFYQEERLACH